MKYSDLLSDLFGDMSLLDVLGPGDDPFAKEPKAPYQQAYDLSRRGRALLARMGAPR